jgi:putative molybdopterin biosynthesis protein|tara:strand:+ start:14536 stop:15426 length:891 start_codon:yes stop_codon:yes gene_type:complete
MPLGKEEFLTTKELASLLRVKERKVYELASNGQVPCTRAMGKLLFPRDAVERWLNDNASGFDAALPRTLPSVFLGSHDPLLDWALRESQCGLATFFDGSLDGLDRFENRGGVATGLHVYNAADKTWNIGPVRARFQQSPVVLTQWVWRERGLIVRPDLKGKVTGLADVKKLKLVPRQREAGSQRLLEQLLDDEGIALADLNLERVARTETEAVIAVYEGAADVAFGLESLARQYRLPFVPMMRERFDLLIDRWSWFEEPLQVFLEFCRTDEFRKRVGEHPGYDAEGMGTILFNGAP